MLAAIFVLVFGSMLVEARRAARNERAQRAHGGVEPPDDVYELMRVTYPISFLVMLAEALMRERLPTPFFVAGGATLFALAKALKWWAIVTLGPAWTFRVIVVPGARLVTRGPYRAIRHPNYIAVVGELVGVALMAGAIITGPLTIVAFGALLKKRIAVEKRALTAAARSRLSASK